MTDNTPHNLDAHTTPPKPHTMKWYEFWGKKCPVCQVPAEATE